MPYECVVLQHAMQGFLEVVNGGYACAPAMEAQQASI